MKKFLMIALLAFSCSPSPTKGDPQKTALDLTQEYTDRMFSKFIDEYGFVISRRNGKPEHVGDAMKYTGVALAVSPCDERSKKMADVLVKHIKRFKGQIRRHEVKVSSTRGETSRDAVVGAIFGMVHYSRNCGYDFSDAWKMHVDYVLKNDWELEPNSNQDSVAS